MMVDAMPCASSAVTWPRSTASLSTCSMRSRVMSIMSSGRIRFWRSASRSSAIVFAEKSALSAGFVAAFAALAAPFCAVC